MKEIIIDVMPDGEVKIETNGFTGKSCTEETQFLKDFLGKEISRELKPVFYTTEKCPTKKKHLPICG